MMSFITTQYPVKHPVLYILVGCPYAGKSTLAEKLSQHNCVHIRRNKIKKQYQADDEQAFNIIEPIIKGLLQQGYNVVFDALHYTEQQRQKSISLALGYDYRIVFLDTPYQELLRRMEMTLQQEITHEGRDKITQPILDSIYKSIEKPQGEKVILLTTNDDIVAFLQTVTD